MEMGRPVSNEAAKKFGNFTMAKKAPSADADDRNKERLINKITGFKSTNDLYVDGKEHNKMGKDEFLKLLTYQLQNQDPLKPMEQQQMAGELAQFSQLEQLSNLNSKFEGMNKNQNIQDKFYGASFLGKEIVTNGSSLNLKETGGESDVLFTLPKKAEKVLVRIFDQKNAMIGEMWRENIGRGNQNITWDGRSLDGQSAVKGEYRVQVYAWDETSEPIEVATKVKGVVESVFFENGESVLKVDGKKVFLRDVDSFHVPGQGRLVQGGDKQIAQALAGVEVKTARNTAPNLPIAQDVQSKVNLNKINQKAGLNTYGKEAKSIGTGLTNIYDTE